MTTIVGALGLSMELETVCARDALALVSQPDRTTAEVGFALWASSVSRRS